jgi:hypothetical protein
LNDVDAAVDGGENIVDGGEEAINLAEEIELDADVECTNEAFDADAHAKSDAIQGETSSSTTTSPTPDTSRHVDGTPTQHPGEAHTKTPEMSNTTDVFHDAIEDLIQGEVHFFDSHDTFYSGDFDLIMDGDTHCAELEGSHKFHPLFDTTAASDSFNIDWSLVTLDHSTLRADYATATTETNFESKCMMDEGKPEALSFGAGGLTSAMNSRRVTRFLGFLLRRCVRFKARTQGSWTVSLSAFRLRRRIACLL